MNLSGISGNNAARLYTIQNAIKDRVTYNVTQSCIDTATALIAENKPRPYFLTSGASYRIQRKAKKLNQFVDGIFYENQAYRLGPLAFRDAAIWGDGFIHVWDRNGRVAFERVLAAELWVDEVEGQYGNARSMTRVKPVDREELIGFLPDKAAIIRGANKASAQETGDYQTISDMVLVRESWRLPSKPGGKDGAHLISIDGHALTAVESWEHDWFPFARIPWCPRPFGFWSQGLAEQLQGIQLELNKLLWVIQRSQHLAGSFKVFLQNGSKIVKEHITNEIGAQVTYTGQPPIFYTPEPVSAGYYQHVGTLIDRAYEQAGISQLSAQAKKPEGLNSGKAIRAYDDKQQGRFSTNARLNEQLYLDIARLAISVAKDIAQDNGGHYEVSVPGKTFLQSIDWKDIDLAEDEYVMQCFPVSSLPTDPEGRLQTIQEYIQAGMLSPRQGKRLLDFPDLEQVEGLANAAEDLLTEVLDRIVDDGEYTPPEPTDDLQLGMELALEYIARGRMQALEPERLEMLRSWKSQAEALMQMALPPAPAPVAGAPQAQAAPPPTSDLVPNVPGMSATA